MNFTIDGPLFRQSLERHDGYKFNGTFANRHQFRDSTPKMRFICQILTIFFTVTILVSCICADHGIVGSALNSKLNQLDNGLDHGGRVKRGWFQ